MHYGACGGCAFADLAGVDKAERLGAALRRAGFADPPIAPLITMPPASRRRVDLAALRLPDGGVMLGLHRARGHEVVDMTECALLEPRLFSLLAPLRVLLRSLQGLRRAGSVIVNWLDNGADLLLRLDAACTAPDRARLIAFAGTQRLLRIAIATDKSESEPVAVLAPPVITLAGVAGRTGTRRLSASQRRRRGRNRRRGPGRPAQAHGEIPRRRAVRRHRNHHFCFGQHARVEAYEGFAPAVAAQQLAARRANLAGRVATHHRDLTRRPLLLSELTGRAAVVLDPPFAGAGPQMKNLAAAGVPRVIYVSCNPDTLATDAAVLRRSGYTVLNATPIDQFPYSENLESVVLFG